MKSGASQISASPPVGRPTRMLSISGGVLEGSNHSELARTNPNLPISFITPSTVFGVEAVPGGHWTKRASCRAATLIPMKAPHRVRAPMMSPVFSEQPNDAGLWQAPWCSFFHQAVRVQDACRERPDGTRAGNNPKKQGKSATGSWPKTRAKRRRPSSGHAGRKHPAADVASLPELRTPRGFSHWIG